MKHLCTVALTGGLMAATVLVALLAGEAPAQRVEATTTTTTSTGTISEFGAQGFAIQTPAGAQPVRFISNDTTNYVDEEGNPVALGSVQAGMPVTIHYTKVGDTLIASKVVVGRMPAAGASKATVVVPAPETAPPAAAGQRVETTTTTTVTRSTGTITEVVPGGFVVSSAAGAEPIRYRYSERTVYLDEAGNPVSVEAVRSGVPVTVHHDRVGNVLIATRVVVGRSSPVAPTPPASVTVPGKVVAPGAEVEVETRKRTTTIER